MLLLFTGGIGGVWTGTLAPAGALTKEVARSFAGTITSAGLRVNVLYLVDLSGTVTPAGVTLKLISRSFAGATTPTGVTTTAQVRSVAWQIDVNVGYAFVASAEAVHQVDEDVLALTAVPSRDALLQIDELMRPQAPVPVTSY